MSYQRPDTEPRTSGLSIASLVLAVLLPILGLVLALVARSKAKREGGPTLVATVAIVAGAVLSLVWTLLIALFIWAGATLFTVATSDDPSEPAPPAPGDSIVLEVSADGELDDETLTAARSLVELQAANAGLDLADAVVDDDTVIVTFAEGTTDTLIEEFTTSLTSPLTDGFYAVDEVRPGSGGGDTAVSCADLPFGSATTGGQTLACDDADQTQYVFDSGPRMSGTDISEVALSGDAVSVVLSADGAQELADWTAEIAPLGTAQIAIVDLSGVITAPVVMSAITGGEFQISGGGSGNLQALTDRLRVLGAGVTFSIER
ncbi:SecDF P1 head subdomain-containing protein [Microbacterium oxydans]|uniref:Protein translocase subunit SecD n=1 Tax=Microbacterium oxydans TaxID=82380 RepID=A0A0F0L6E8_9MICO|nr:hypothetical protein [Microbacterium oxydans]KJL28708.1 Protein translocase subunit SecD [Microbacterium oxydans]